MAESRQVYLLPLKDDGSPDIPGRYINLPPPTAPPYVLRFLIEGTSLICHEGSLWVNIPESDNGFDRQKFRRFRSVGTTILCVACIHKFGTACNPVSEITRSMFLSPRQEHLRSMSHTRLSQNSRFHRVPRRNSDVLHITT